MGISRSRGIYPTGYFGPLYGTAAYAKQGGEIFQYVSDGSGPNDVAGATYRTHVFDNTGYNTIYFDKPGYVDVILIAGGGAGGSGTAHSNTNYTHIAGGGGGGGGIVEYYGYQVNVGAYPIYVGKHGTTQTGSSLAGDGEYSTFDGLKAFGGGMGGVNNVPARNGGSGGGGTYNSGRGSVDGGNGITNQGFAGGNNDSSHTGGGGGGAGGVGVSGNSNNSRPDGGPGKFITFYSNTGQYYSGGGAGAISSGGAGTPQGGIGGGADAPTGVSYSPSSANYYGGGGGGGTTYTRGTNATRSGGNGYQGLVMIRYRIY